MKNYQPPKNHMRRYWDLTNLRVAEPRVVQVFTQVALEEMLRNPNGVRLPGRLGQIRFEKFNLDDNHLEGRLAKADLTGPEAPDRELRLQGGAYWLFPVTTPYWADRSLSYGMRTLRFYGSSRSRKLVKQFIQQGGLVEVFPKNRANDKRTRNSKRNKGKNGRDDWAKRFE